MKKQVLKTAYSLVLVVVLLVSVTAPVSFADSAGLIRAKSWIATAITALNIGLEPVGYALSDAVQQAVDPLNIVTTIQEADYQEYMNRSTIKIYPDTVVIDGVSYSDIWLSHDAADIFRTDGIDFSTAYNIASESQGTYASGAGTLAGLPAYDDGSKYTTPHYGISADGTYAFGDVGFTTTYYNNFNQTHVGNGTLGVSGWASGNYPYEFYLYRSYDGTIQQFRFDRNGSNQLGGSAGGTFIENPFSFDYTSGLIPVDPIADDEGLYLRVPTSYVNPDPQGQTIYNYDIHDFVVQNPEIDPTDGFTFEFDPDLNPDYQTDIDLNNGLGDLISAIIGGIITGLITNDDIIIDYATDPEPVPPVEETIANTPYAMLDNILQSIKSVIDSILQHIDDGIQIVSEKLDDIIQSLSEIPQTILEDIETGSTKVFRKALDILKSIFLPLLMPIKALMGLWHYVVEWLSSITLPFSWIFGLMSSTSSNMVLPIYAAVAGSLCIALYKALGR